LLDATSIEADNCKPLPDEDEMLTMNVRRRLVHACKPLPSRLDPMRGRIWSSKSGMEKKKKKKEERRNIVRESLCKKRKQNNSREYEE
jgi:hypothetical protein